MSNLNINYNDWIEIFDKAKLLKSSLVLVGIDGKLIGFDETLSILRTIDIVYYNLPVFSFMVKDLKPIYDAVSSGPLNLVFKDNTAYTIYDNGELYPVLEINTNPFYLKDLFDKYNRMMNMVYILPMSECITNMKNTDIILQYNNLKADDGNIIFRNGTHSLIMFYGWFKMNKSDDVSMTFYDILGTNKFITKIDILKGKGKDIISTYTINFNIISTIPF